MPIIDILRNSPVRGSTQGEESTEISPISIHYIVVYNSIVNEMTLIFL